MSTYALEADLLRVRRLDLLKELHPLPPPPTPAPPRRGRRSRKRKHQAPATTKTVK